MSIEDNKALFRRFIEEFWNNGDLEVADELFAPDAVSPLPQVPAGPEGAKTIARMILSAFPDFQMTIEGLIAEGDLVAARFIQRGTHLGEFMGVPATGVQAAWTEVGILRVADGRIVQSWYESDLLGLMQQLGAFPAAARETQQSLATGSNANPRGRTNLAVGSSARDDRASPRDLNANAEENTMSNEVTERNRQIGQRFVDFILRGGDPSTLFSPEFVYYDSQGTANDLAATMARIGPIVGAIPDRNVQVEEEIITDDRVVLRWRRSGTFQNDAWGLRATGNRVSDVGVTILGIDANGMISQSWEYWDVLNFFTQLGVIREYVANTVAESAPASAPGSATD